MKKTSRFYKIITLGCKVNQYDSDCLKNHLENIGFKPTEKNADLILLNTCAVTKSALAKNRQALKMALKNSPTAKVAVIGCWPKTDSKPSGLKADLFWRGNDYALLIKKIQGLFPSVFEPILDSGFKLANSHRSRYFMKIQDGCEQFCSYCIIPYARGPLKSRSEKEVLAEIKAASEAGYAEIVLSGIHLGLYGREKNSESRLDLAGLLRRVIKIKKLGRIRLSSIEINEVTDELIGIIKGNQKICKHLHIPLQSGCDKILTAMNRPYTIGFFQKRIEKIRKECPEIAISTDVIVGFPGENETDFFNSYNYVKNLKLSRLHVFSFSAHEKTPAYHMVEKNSPEIIKERSICLRDLGVSLEKEFRQKFYGQELDVAVETQRKGGYRGKSEHYLDIDFTQNDIVDFYGVLSGDLRKKIVKVEFWGK